MAYLSSYLSSRSAPKTNRRTYGTAYTYPRAYQPYTVPRRGVQGVQSSSPFGSQDLASALLQQKQVNAASAPSTSFESSFNYDPILSKIQALASQTVNNATTNAAQLRKDALISSGDVGVGTSLGLDANTLTAAGQNPESEYAQLQREFASRQKQLEEAMSAQNLLYSGEYANQLSLLNQGKASAEGGIGSRLREMLAGIDTGLLTSQETARQQQLDAATQAALVRSGYEMNPNGSVTDSSGLEWDLGSAAALSRAGYSGDAVSAAAGAYATAHGFSVHGVKQEGHIEYQNGVPGVWIKYDTPGGSSTEWTPLGAPDLAPVGNTNTPPPPPPPPDNSGFGPGQTPPNAGTGAISAATQAAQAAPTTPLDYILGAGRGIF